MRVANETFSSNESMEEEEVLRDFDAQAELIIQKEMLPKKSADRYTLVYEIYKKCQMEHKSSLSSSEESNLIVYFKYLHKTVNFMEHLVDVKKNIKHKRQY